jgi:hypothetical protein
MNCVDTAANLPIYQFGGRPAIVFLDDRASSSIISVMTTDAYAKTSPTLV